jgi:hypothetical protein
VIYHQLHLKSSPVPAHSVRNNDPSPSATDSNPAPLAVASAKKHVTTHAIKRTHVLFLKKRAKKRSFIKTPTNVKPPAPPKPSMSQQYSANTAVPITLRALIITAVRYGVNHAVRYIHEMLPIVAT